MFQPITLKVGDSLLLTRGDAPGRPAELDAQGRVLAPARIPCTLDAVFDAARPGQPIWFDDGKIGGLILANGDGVIEVEITQAAPQGSKLRAEKGINLPETDLDIPALTTKDLADLAVMAPLVDMVGLSFVREPADVLALQGQMQALGAGHLGTVLKIETRQGFENLPMILLASLRHPPVGVMVARGDLAVEVGFERLAEVQEEILWLCEAAHIPVIWATQVLESMAKRGIPSRAEVSDAALAVRAECVMLNKGPYIVETVQFLDGVLERMSGHQVKRRPVSRRLAVSQLPTEGRLSADNADLFGIMPRPNMGPVAPPGGHVVASRPPLPPQATRPALPAGGVACLGLACPIASLALADPVAAPPSCADPRGPPPPGGRDPVGCQGPEADEATLPLAGLEPGPGRLLLGQLGAPHRPAHPLPLRRPRRAQSHRGHARLRQGHGQRPATSFCSSAQASLPAARGSMPFTPTRSTASASRAPPRGPSPRTRCASRGSWWARPRGRPAPPTR